MASGINKIKVLIITSSNPRITSGQAVLDMYQSLKNNNLFEVKILSKKHYHFNNSDIVSFDSKFFYYKTKFQKKFKSVLNKIKPPLLDKTNRNYAIQELDQTITKISTKTIVKKIPFHPDAVIVSFNVGFLSYKNLSELSMNFNIPVFIKMADMSPMTGGCHYAWDCKGYFNNCGHCPAYKSNSEHDQSRKNFIFKQHYIQKGNLIPIAGSEQHYQQLLKSSLFKDIPKYKIINSIDPKIYKPGNKNISREKLSLPLDKKIIFFGATFHTTRRKGLKELIKALNILSISIDDNLKSNILLVSAGKSMDFILDIDLPYKSIGFLSHEELVYAYQASDIYLSPSVEDSGPMMLRQAAMTGTPSVAFNIGNALDFVFNGKTGHLAELYDTNDFANGIRKILKLNKVEYEKMSQNCRQNALQIASPEIQAKNFKNIIMKHNSQVS